MPRPIVVLLCAAAIASSVAACGGSSANTSSSHTTSAASNPPAAATTSAATTSPAPPRPPAGGTAQKLALAADPSGQLAFNTSHLTARAGRVTITFTNGAPEGHNLTVQSGSGGPVLGATPTFQGGAHAVSVTLKPGTYTFYCSVPGHRAGGMQGTLTVT